VPINQAETMSQQLVVGAPMPPGRLGMIRCFLGVRLVGVLLIADGCSSPQATKTSPPSAYRSAPYRPVAKKIETPQAPSTKRVEIASEPTGIPVGRSPALWDSAKKIEIVSEPAGARIEVNDDYVGDAPITVPIRTVNSFGTQ
jgi:hypothetical protein